MVEYITRSTTHGMPMKSQTLITSFKESVSKAVEQGFKYDEIPVTEGIPILEIENHT